MSFGNGTSQTFAMNDRLQMTNQTLSRSSEILQKYDYGYGQIDANGNLDTTKNNGQLSQIESHIGASKQWTQKFRYDSIGRLSEAEEKRGDTSAVSYKQKFDFDRFGNLYRKNASNPTSGQQTPLLFTPIEDADISKSTNRFTTNTTYDDAGNVVQDNKFRLMNFSYDANGRMFKTSNIDTTNQANSVYDASGNRVATKVSDVWTFLIYDAFGKMIAEYGGLSAMDEGGVKYVLQDWQGSSRAVISQSGYVQARMDYQAFGEEIYANVGLRSTTQGFNANTNLSQKYALTERDKATGLDHTWFRKNENKAGRWTSPDPYNGSMSLGNPQSFNRYSYVENQPTNFVDPSGLLSIRGTYNCVWSGEGYTCTIYITQFISDQNIGGSGVDSGGGSPNPPNNERCKDTLTLADKNSDEGALSRLIFQEATPLSEFGNAFQPTASGSQLAIQNYQTEMNYIAAIVYNRQALLNSRPGTGFGSSGATISDIIYSRGASGTQFAGFTPSGISTNVQNRINNALNGRADSADCEKLKDAINTAKNYNGQYKGQVYGMRTLDSTSPGGNFVKLDGLVGSGNDFYTLSDSFLNPGNRRRRYW